MEAIASMILIPLAFWLDVSKVERALLISSLLILLIVEMLNTAIEVLLLLSLQIIISDLISFLEKKKESLQGYTKI